MLRKSALGAAFVLTALLVAAPAQAAVTCTYSSAQARVDVAMSAPADLVTVSRSGLRIMANGLQCGTATVKNTNAVYVTADAAEQTVIVQLSGGAFAPGKSKEPRRGISEIEFRVNLGNGTDTVTVIGGAQAETIRLGTGGMNLNGDGDADLLTTGVDKWEIAAGGGADTVSGAGAFGTGGTYSGPLVITGDAGHDTLTGGLGADSVYGGAGNDRMSGGAGVDMMLGDAGRDRLDGGDGPDQLTPGTGEGLGLRRRRHGSALWGGRPRRRRRYARWGGPGLRLLLLAHRKSEGLARQPRERRTDRREGQHPFGHRIVHVRLGERPAGWQLGRQHGSTPGPATTSFWPVQATTASTAASARPRGTTR